LSALPEDAAIALLRRIGRDMQAQAPNHRMSALQDLEAGRALEVHETLGYAVTEATRLGLNAPALRLCYSLTAGLDALPR
jgi:2-dehydropantoate 2-reductase